MSSHGAEDAKRPEQMQAEAAFMRRMVRDIRGRLFKGVPEKEWFQRDERLVRLAIMAPAEYIHERGGALTAERYRVILMTCVVEIEEHAERAEIRKMAYYFLACVQKHMQHRGDTYYEESKAARGIGSTVKAALRDLTQIGARDLTTALAVGAAVLKTKHGQAQPKEDPRQGRLF